MRGKGRTSFILLLEHGITPAYAGKSKLVLFRVYQL